MPSSSDESNLQLCAIPGSLVVRRRPGEAIWWEIWEWFSKSHSQIGNLAIAFVFWGVFFTPQDDALRHGQVCQGVDEGLPDQEPVMVIPISDLNSIENLWNVWDGQKPSNKAELLEFLLREWHKVTQQPSDWSVEDQNYYYILVDGKTIETEYFRAVCSSTHSYFSFKFINRVQKSMHLEGLINERMEWMAGAVCRACACAVYKQHKHLPLVIWCLTVQAISFVFASESSLLSDVSPDII